jgi:hypothetical protein
MSVNAQDSEKVTCPIAPRKTEESSLKIHDLTGLINLTITVIGGPRTEDRNRIEAESIAQRVS